MTAPLRIRSSQRMRRVAWSLDEVAAGLGVDRSTIERAARDGRIESIRIGRLVRIPDQEVRRIAVEGITRARSRADLSAGLSPHPPPAGT
jgi:excisionase family DNA binding protein